MRLRSLTVLLSLTAGLLLAACESSSNPVTDTDNPNNPNNPAAKANGTVTLGGKAVPVLVSGLYDDTSMLMTAYTDIEGTADTGWSFLVNAEPGKGTISLQEDTRTLLGNTVSHNPGAGGQSCLYHITSGSLQIEAWAETPVGAYFTATMSGGGTLTLEASAGMPHCAALTVQLAFANALASSLGK